MAMGSHVFRFSRLEREWPHPNHCYQTRQVFDRGMGEAVAGGSLPPPRHDRNANPTGDPTGWRGLGRLDSAMRFLNG